MKEKEEMKLTLQQEKQDLLNDYNERRTEEIARVTREFEAKIEAKNDQILADQQRQM